MSQELAILGGEKLRKQDYPQWPIHDERDVEAVTRVVRSGQWGGYPYPGPETAQFVKSFIEMQGGTYGVAMMNGTITMEVALRASGIGWGDEVIVPAYTFQATAAAPMAAGATPVLVDIDPNNYCIDPRAIEKAITSKTRAIIPVHLGAQMADMDAIMSIADKHNLIVIEDCAHAHGAKWNGKGSGTLGHFGSFSMQSSKILTGGEGGMLLCRTEKMALLATSIIDCGRPHDAKGELYTMGANYRMSELHSALLNVGIERFPAQAAQRETMANYMDEALSEVPGVRVLPRDERHTTRSFYRYIFAIDPEAFGATHEVVTAALDAEGIPCGSGYPPMHHYDLFQPQISKLPAAHAFVERFNLAKMNLPEAERAGERESVWLDECIFRADYRDVDDVIAGLKKVQTRLASDKKLGKQIQAKIDEFKTV
jgi:dTDP-4-amino-4,6-dideoxygalactose transaminase